MHFKIKILILISCLLFFFQGAQAATKPNIPQYYLRYTKYTIKQLIDKGHAFAEKGEMDSCMVVLTVIANSADDEALSKEEQRIVVNALNNLGYFYYRFYNDYELGDRYLTQALDMAKKYKYDRILPTILINRQNISYLYNTFTHGDKSYRQNVEEMKQIFYLSLKLKSWECVAISFNNMAELSVLNDDLALISREIKRMDSVRLPAGVSKRDEALLLHEVCKADERHDYARGIALTSRYLEKHPFEKTDIEDIVSAYSILAKHYQLKGEIAQSLSTVGKLDKLVKDIDQPVVHLVIYSHLKQYFEMAGDSVRAQHYDYLMLKEKEVVQNDQKLGNVAKNRFVHELNNINAALKAEAQKRQVAIVVSVLLGVILVVIVVLLVLMVRWNRRQARYVHLLYEKNQQLLASNQLLKEQTSEPEPEPAPKTDDEDSTVYEQVAKQIEAVMQNKEEILSLDFSLSKLCNLAGYNQTYVSRAIRRRWNTNFSGLLNTYRITAACRLMTDVEHYGNMTIEAIGREVGYQSRAHFSTVFKKITGITATEYIRLAKEKG